MKEFEKRWNFRYRNVSKHQSFEKEIGKYFWKAALEMVKREIFEHQDALDIIEEELGR